MSEFLKEGDVFELKAHHHVRTSIPEHFLYANRKGVWTCRDGVVSCDGELAYLQGEYVVTGTAMDGGGTGHGPHDVFPNGHHVFAEKLDNGTRVDFYQSGAFIHLNTGIVATGRARRSGWTKEERA